MTNNQINQVHFTPIQMKFPVDLEKIIEISDPIYTFNEIMNEVDLRKYLVVKGNKVGRPRLDSIKLLKIILFAFMEFGYVSLRRIEALCKTDIRFIWLLDGMEAPSFMTIANFINEFLIDTIENIFNEINSYIFEKENVDLNHVYIDGTKLEANANKYSWVWKKSCITNRNKMFLRITRLIEEINNSDLIYLNVEIGTRQEYFLHSSPVRGNKFGRTEEYYQCEDCNGCPYREKCLKSEKNRIIRLNEELTSFHKEVINNLECVHGALLRMNRSIQAEGTYGTIKWNREYTRVRRRGLKQVFFEFSAICLGFNLHKYHLKKQKALLAA